MATNKRYTVKFRRSRLRKTDYRSRLRLLVSRKSRLVIRKSINQICLQIVDYDKTGDRTGLTLHSNKLKKYGWKYKLNNLPASYLSGLLLGLEAKKKGIKELVLDIGVRTSVKGSVIYSALKGVVDSGIKIPHNPDVLPNQDRLKGKHISDYALLLKKNPEIYKKEFSRYLKNNVNPEDITKNFDYVKEKILNENKNA